MQISIAGTGYVGLVTGVCLASRGHQVTCVDIDEKKISLMQAGRSPIFEDGLEALMQRHLDRLTFTMDSKAAYKNAEVIFIGVGTPEKKDGSANLKFVYQVVQEIARYAERDCVVVVKSTVPIGTNDKIEATLREHLAHPVAVDVVSNPEFLSQGTAVHDTLHGARIVIGAENERAAAVMKEVYKDFGIPMVITNRRSAEMIKYASNDFLALKISYINEIANLCEIVGANIEDVTKGMSYDARIGDKFLNAGIGYGGSCFPKDTKALHWLANYHDYELKTIKAAIEVNENQKIKLFKKAHKYYDGFAGLTVAVLGLSFKPGTDDLREAPSMQNVPMLVEDGAAIQAWDPVSTARFRQACPADSIVYCDTIKQALTGADICFIFTEWPEVKRLDTGLFKKLMRRAIVIDGRNCYGLDRFKGQGVIYESIGRPVVGETG